MKKALGSLAPLGYLLQVRTELGKVTWPDRRRVVKLSILVIVVSLISGAYLGALDFVFTKLIALLINR